MFAQLIGPDGMIVVAVVALLLVFGGTRLPKLARSAGSASHEFRKGLSEGEREAAASEHHATAPSNHA